MFMTDIIKLAIGVAFGLALSPIAHYLVSVTLSLIFGGGTISGQPL
jgi:hypothetical protein